MARVKVFAGSAMTAAAWLAVAATTLGIAYGGSAMAAHMGTWIEWR